MMLVPPPRAVRDNRIAWQQTVEDALKPLLGALPLGDTVKNTLTMLQSYTESPLELYANASTGITDTKSHVALLLTLDKVVMAWPSALQQRLTLPSVHLSVPHAQDYLRHYTPVRPRAEAVLVCYNAAVANMEAGLDSMDRVRAEAAAGGYGATRLPASTGTAAKAAHKSFQRAQELLRLTHDILVAESGLVPNASKKMDADVLLPLAATDRHELHCFLDLATVRSLTSLCASIAKYLFSLSSNATSERPDLLARLAYEAASVVMPSTCGALCVLPTLLLAAYHRHMGEFYYSSGRQKAGVPDMSRALGHIRYADHLLQDVSVRYAGPVPTVNSFKASVGKWRDTLLSAVGTALALRGRGRVSSPDGVGEGEARDASTTALLSNPPPPSPEELDNEDDESRALRRHREKVVASYNRLLQAADEHGEADLQRVFPVLHKLLHQTNQLLQQYERENRVVYFAAVTSPDSVRDDVPGGAGALNDGRDDDSDGEVARRDQAVRALASQLPLSMTFSDLPSPDVLERELARATAATQNVDALTAAIDQLDAVLRTMETTGSDVPATVRAAVEAVGPCLAHEGTVDAALAMAETAIEKAWVQLVQAEEAWRDRKGAHLGAICEPHLSLDKHKRAMNDWRTRITAARDAWHRTLEVPSGEPITTETALMTCLLPERRDMQQAMAAAQAVRDEGAQAMTTLLAGAPVGESASIARVIQKVQACAEDGAALVQMWSETHAADAVEREVKLAAIHDVVRAIWEAPHLVTSMEEVTAELTAETERVGPVRPLDRIRDGAVQFATRPRQGTSAKVATSSPHEAQDRDQTGGITEAKIAPLRSAKKRGRPQNLSPPRSEDEGESGERRRDAENAEEDSVASSDLGTPMEASFAEEPTEAKVSAAFLSKLKARRQVGATKKSPHKIEKHTSVKTAAATKKVAAKKTVATKKKKSTK